MVTEEATSRLGALSLSPSSHFSPSLSLSLSHSPSLCLETLGFVGGGGREKVFLHSWTNTQTHLNVLLPTRRRTMPRRSPSSSANSCNRLTDFLCLAESRLRLLDYFCFNGPPPRCSECMRVCVCVREVQELLLRSCMKSCRVRSK